MENNDLLYAIGRYCKSQHFAKTFKSVTQLTGKRDLTQNPEKQSLTLIFETYFKNHNNDKTLSFTFNLQTKRSELRKRLLAPSSNQTVTQNRKKRKYVKDRKSDVPDEFLTLLDELALDRKDAKLLYENKDQWAFVKSDRLTFCSERGKNFTFEILEIF